MMKARDQALRAKRFDVAEKARKARDLEAMIRDFDVMAVDLDRQIAAEEERTGIKDAQHFAYSTFAKSAALRRANLVTSAADLRAKYDAAIKDHDDAREELQRLEGTEKAPESRDNTDRRDLITARNPTMSVS